jgi:hypothetical protein
MTETQIVLGKGSKVHVWRKECEQWALYGLGEGRTRQPRVVASVMFWSCITHEGVGTFVPVDGTINSEKYIQILDKITFFQKCSTVKCSFDLHHALRLKRFTFETIIFFFTILLEER